MGQSKKHLYEYQSKQQTPASHDFSNLMTVIKLDFAFLFQGQLLIFSGAHLTFFPPCDNIFPKFKDRLDSTSLILAAVWIIKPLYLQSH